MKNVIKIGNAKFWTDYNDILYCKFNNDNPSYKLDSDKVKLYIRAITKICNGKAMPFLIDARDSRGTFSSSAANLFAKTPALAELKISEAFIHNSIGIKLLIGSYKRIYDPITPFGVFNDMVTALEYCIDTKNDFYGSN
ncbi:DUF7793 family protein [Flaviramulus basaltis]|nr:hypothetical protein [Flaviramulus basaltis]